MTYVRSAATRPIIPIEQARRINAALRLELATLTAEHADIAPKVEALRTDVAAARKKLTRQLRDLDTIRAQISDIETLAQHTANTAPKYGGREGLQAATDEIKAYDTTSGINTTTLPRGRKGPRHGTQRRYNLGCRCDSCAAWRKKKSEQSVAQNKARREREIAAAVQAALGKVA